MSYQAVFKGWDELEQADLLVAYRKAKADVFFENIFPTAIKFADFEQDLLVNLDNLLAKLKANHGFAKDESLLGDFRLVPKKLGLEKKKGVPSDHVHFSDANRAFDCLLERNELRPGFRIIGDFPVETHVISALWINMVGHKLDACLDDTAYGSRLRRIRTEELIGEEEQRPFHLTAVGSFQPYYQPYKKWRSDGLRAIRTELENDRDVIAVSLDLRSFYHQIDPSFLGSKGFFSDLGLIGDDGLSDPEVEFTGQLSRFLVGWAHGAEKFATRIKKGGDTELTGGLTIGLTVSRVVSNVLLHRWDQLVQEKLTPVHYGRYVDDMFLVMRDPGNLSGMQDLMEFLQKRLGSRHFKEGEGLDGGLWEISLGKRYQKGSMIHLQAQKQKMFVLKGQSGMDLLDTIEKEIHELSSEYRLMPSPDQLEQTTAAKVLSAAGSVGEGADNLRRADDLTIQRLSWSLQMRHVETLSRDLPKNAWKKQRNDFYQFAHDHVLRPDKLFDHFNYLPRLLGFAVALDEWEQAEAIVGRSFAALDQLESATGDGKGIEVNGKPFIAKRKLWGYVRSALAWWFIDAAARFYNPDNLLGKSPSKRVARLAKLFLEQRSEELHSIEGFLTFDFGVHEFYEKAPLLARCDLARFPYKEILTREAAKALSDGKKRPKSDRLLEKVFKDTGLLDIDALSDFLNKSRKARLHRLDTGKRSGEVLRPYLFPTRPYTPVEIAELVPWCVGLGPPAQYAPSVQWARFVRALRGVWVKPTLLGEETTDAKALKKRRRTIRIGDGETDSIIVAITNLLTTDEMWAASASGRPKLTLDRYKRISDLVNQAIRVRPKPDYLLLPELSLPREWLYSLGSRLNQSGINLIAGTEYSHPDNKTVVSHACLQLIDNRMGFPTPVRIWQEKREPAAGEDKELTSKFGKVWASTVRGKRKVYRHNDFYFGVMVCSELQNSKARVSFQGNVDALMVLSWNQDLETFSALVEAGALDVHAYTVLVNNRKYGDSRVRSPAKESFLRDLARVRGGENDFCVTVRLNVKALRAFQSRAKRWPEKTDLFKPVPEGFRLHPGRRVKPPK
ncbi:MAG: RNA-directed DNA polymerase [Candidatus Thiodiazotropha sp.]